MQFSVWRLIDLSQIVYNRPLYEVSANNVRTASHIKFHGQLRDNKNGPLFVVATCKRFAKINEFSFAKLVMSAYISC